MHGAVPANNEGIGQGSESTVFPLFWAVHFYLILGGSVLLFCLQLKVST